MRATGALLTTPKKVKLYFVSFFRRVAPLPSVTRNRRLQQKRRTRVSGLLAARKIAPASPQADPSGCRSFFINDQWGLLWLG